MLSLLSGAGHWNVARPDNRLQNVRVRDLQADEIWAYVQKKEGHKHPWEENDESIGDAYTFIPLERTSKLIVAWHLGRRDKSHTEAFIAKVRRATADTRFEICTDAFQPHQRRLAD